MAPPANIKTPLAANTASSQYQDLSLWIPTYGYTSGTVNSVVGSNNLTLTSVTTTNNATLGTVLTFDGSAGKAKGTAQIVCARGAFAVAMWFIDTDATATNERAMISSWNYSSGLYNNGWTVGRNIQDSGDIGFQVRRGGNGTARVANTFNDSSPHMLVGQRMTDGTLELWIDGELVDDTHDDASADATDTGDSVIVGAQNEANGGVWKGSIGEIRIYGATLSEAEIGAMYADTWDLYAKNAAAASAHSRRSRSFMRRGAGGWF